MAFNYMRSKDSHYRQQDLLRHTLICIAILFLPLSNHVLHAALTVPVEVQMPAPSLEKSVISNHLTGVITVINLQALSLILRMTGAAA